jgi:hypothetical protein
MAKSKSGTPTAGPYTVEQLAALEKMKQRGLKLGAAQKKYVNHLLNPDGTVTADTKVMLSAARKRSGDLLAGDTTDPAVLTQASQAAAKVKEIEAMIEEKRFLFIVDGAGLPVIYFQCATPGNPDVY